jgi:GNAT superfamily N-acetyltransferase
VYSPGAKYGTGEHLVGVIVYSRSPLSLAARNRATGGRYRLARCGRVATASLINQELRIISRVVVAPNWRGLGLASRLVAETMPLVGTPYVEALAAMGEMHPLFVRAGMTAYPQGASKEGERLAAALESAGLARADRRSAVSLAAALDALGPSAPRRLADREIARWARSYLGAKNHRTNQPDRRRMLELVARHLDSRPVYYLWRRK